MSWVRHEIQRNESSYYAPSSQFLPSPPPPPPSPSSLSLDDRISPSILLIIVILAVIFFISGFLHLVRFLIRPSQRDPDDLDNVSVLQGQLQQLFHLHDSGVDQSFIDTLPVFLYKNIIGVKNPFDCAVCLCEFEADDKLRLLPKCSHAFHLDCIDTWLLSHSTCPLCRGSLLPDFSSNACSPIVLVLESSSESSREIGDRDLRDSASAAQINSSAEDGFVPSCTENSQKSVGNLAKEETKVVAVKLGKLRNVDAAVGADGDAAGGGGGGVVGVSGEISLRGESSSSLRNVDSRRCYSMGSFEYVLDEASHLQVPVASMKRKRPMKKPPLAVTPGHRPTISMIDIKNSESRREGFRIPDSHSASSAAIQEGKQESFSISKIWLRTRKDRLSSAADSSRRAFSFRLPVHKVEDTKLKPSSSQRTVASEIEAERWSNHGDFSSMPRSECGGDDGSCSFHSLDSQTNPTPSFARRTINWIVGRQKKVMHSAPLPPV